MTTFKFILASLILLAGLYLWEFSSRSSKDGYDGKNTTPGQAKQLDYELLESKRKLAYPQSRVVFLTFGGGGERYYRAVDRILDEAKDMNVFSEYIGVLDSDLEKDTFFWDKMGAFIMNPETYRGSPKAFTRRGYGYMCWKMYIIWKQLLRMKDGELLLFADAGCELNPEGRERFLSWVKELEVGNADIQVSTACRKDSNGIPCTERRWTKKQVLDFFEISEDDRDRLQYASGIIFIRRDAKMVRFFEELVQIIFKYPQLLTDDISDKEDPIFVENRHDQSLLSCALHRYRNTIKAQVIFDGNLSSKKMDPKAPIIAARNRN